MEVRQLPARPRIERYEREARKLGVSPAKARLQIAGAHGFASWVKFAGHLDRLTDKQSQAWQFEAAADAIVTGNSRKLRRLLKQNPKLIRARSPRVHGAPLLHYIAANGVEDFRQKTPPNAVEICQILLDAGAQVDATTDVYGGNSTALGLVATSTHPRQAGVQLDLIDLLLEHGASFDAGMIPAALASGRPEAAVHLALRGAPLDLEGAAGIGLPNMVRSFFRNDGRLKPGSTKAQLQRGFLWACEYGRGDVIEFLLDHGADLHGQASTGLNGLQWAIIGGQIDTIETLLQHGADLEARNAYGGTALGTATWAIRHGNPDVDYPAIEELLRQRGAMAEEA